MTKFLLICFLISSHAIAAFPIIDVQNVYGDYLDENGAAYASKATYKIPKAKISHQNIEVKFNKKQKNLVISDPSTTVELEFDFSILNIFKAFSFQGLDIKSNDEIFFIEGGNLDFYINEKKYHMENAYLETDITNIETSKDEDITVIDGVILNGVLQVRKLTFEKFDDIVFEDVKVENPDYLDEVRKWVAKKAMINIPMIVRKLNFDIKKGYFTGRALIDSYINLWFRMIGRVETNKNNTQVKIHIKSARLGYFAIKNTILSMIKRLKLDKVRVEGDIIWVDLKNN